MVMRWINVRKLFEFRSVCNARDIHHIRFNMHFICAKQWFQVVCFHILLLQSGRTTVHYAAMEGHKEVVELLIDKYSLSATEKNDVSFGCNVWSVF